MANILCAGNVSLDIKAYSAEVDDTEAYREGSIELVAGGVGRGMAINLKHLGMTTYIHSVVGKDIFGEYLKKDLTGEQVDISLLGESDERKTALFSVMASRGKSATCVYSTHILKEILFDKKIADFIKEKNIDTIVMDSNLSEDTLEGYYSYKKAHPEIFVFQNATAPDIARKTMQYAPLIDLFGCNEFEAAAILGETAYPDLTTADKFQALGYKNFIITFGGQGVMVRIGKETWNEPPYNPHEIVDTIGAGDAFASGFLMGFLEKAPVKNCIHYGLTCAKETLMTRQTVSNKLSKSFLESTRIL